MQIIGIIPARYASTRFPGKPLADIKGKSMIQRVYEQAKQCKALDEVFVATDDQGIHEHVELFGKVGMTETNHICGTSRCLELANTLNLNEEDVIINIQGDEPYISPNQIKLIADSFNNSDVKIATLIKEITNTQTINDSNTVKAVIDKNSNAMYFSRAPIPFIQKDAKPNYYKHIGIYGYRYKTLQTINSYSPTPLEQAESLEQLRWLENGAKIKCIITKEESISVDSPEDLDKL